jgi:hypothetical protein
LEGEITIVDVLPLLLLPDPLCCVLPLLMTTLQH